MRHLIYSHSRTLRSRYFVLYIIGDMTFYLVQKVLRGDFRYWFPIDGASGLLVSLLMRVASKRMVDFTGVINFRLAACIGQ